MPDKLLGPEYGLSNSKLEECTANPSDVMNGKTFYSGDKSKKTGTFSFTGNATPDNVLSGKTFYAGDKNLKSGSVKNARDLTSVRLDSGNDIPLFYGIDGGFHYNTDGGFRYCIWSNLGGQRVFVDGTNTWICFSIDDYKLPSNIGWNTTINPGGSVIIPKGYHDGTGVVRANPASAQVRVETGRQQWNLGENPWNKGFGGTIFAAGVTWADEDGGGIVTTWSGSTMTVNNGRQDSTPVTFNWICAYYI